MNNDETKKLLKELHLKADCFSGEIIPKITFENINGIPQIKLYHKICFACNEEGRSSLYPLDRIIRLNKGRTLPFHNCKDECKSDGCVISLRIYEGGRTAFTKINKIEIIYL